MDSTVQAEYSYARLVLTCNPSTVEGVHALLRDKFAIDSPVPNGFVIRSVVVHDDLPAPKKGWASIASLALGMAASTIITIAGLIKLFEWIVG